MPLTVNQPPPIEGRSSLRETARATAQLVTAANVSGRFGRTLSTAGTGAFEEIWSEGMPKNSAWLVEAVFVGRSAAGGNVVGTFIRRATFWRDEGDVTQRGTTQTIAADENNLGGSSAVDISVDNSDTTKKVRARVKDGGADTDWAARVEVQSVTGEG